MLGMLHGAGGSQLHCMVRALHRGLFEKDQTWDFLAYAQLGRPGCHLESAQNTTLQFDTYMQILVKVS